MEHELRTSSTQTAHISAAKTSIIALLALALALTALFTALLVFPTPSFAAAKGTPAKLIAVAKAEYDDIVKTYGKGAQSYATEVRLAKKYVEYVEGKGASPEPWCADFASYCLYKAGYTKLYGATKHAYHHDFMLDVVKGTAQGVVHKATKDYTPQKGDLVIRCASSCGLDCGKGSSGEHVAIVINVSSDGKTFKTIGGNESNTVCKKTYETSVNTWDWFVTYGAATEKSCTHENKSSLSACKWKGTQCDDCGAINLTMFCDGGIHKYKKVAAKESTCSEAGYSAHKACKGCGKTIGKTTIAKLAHTWSKWSTAQKLSCTQDELQKRMCSVCSKIATRAVTKATGHSWGKWVVTKKATCTKAGSKQRTCSTCGTVKTKAIKATGHSIIEATCTSAKTCSTCSKTWGKALGHSYKQVKEKAATCTKEGHGAYKLCTRCGKKKDYRAIAATGHKFNKKGVCKTCGAKKE